jgi:2-polyprenyl-3-methyl-5-hydroxy-6-metoxy-1,4-benzoquinol methylase
MSASRTRDLLVMPPSAIYTEGGGGYVGKYKGYSHYNYMRPGLLTTLKRSRFVTALKLGLPYFNSGTALDVGCGDCFFIPTLSRQFQRVVGIEYKDDALEHGRNTVKLLGLSNVSLICNATRTWDDLRTEVGKGAKVAFCLETIEHVGKGGADMYPSKVAFVAGIMSLLDADGMLIASVPRMVGPTFLAKHLAMVATGMHVEKFTFRDLIRSGIFYDTSTVEPRWVNGHLGFNHLTLIKALREKFDVTVHETLVSPFLIIRRKAV